ncbi:MAG: hypothetical protein J6R54_02610 [Bacteroidaceae bacterium]|nr:hypothetical protein [Bacteroidaceae bacterium]
MKTKESLDKFRIPVPSFMDIPFYEETDEHGYYATGAFRVGTMVILVSHNDDEGGWHLSMSHKNTMPTYEEMKDFRYKFLPNGINACEILPPREKFVNRHPFCRHLWEMPKDDIHREEFI